MLYNKLTCLFGYHDIFIHPLLNNVNIYKGHCIYCAKIFIQRWESNGLWEEIEQYGKIYNIEEKLK